MSDSNPSLPEQSNLKLKKRVENEEYIAPPARPSQTKKKRKKKEKQPGRASGRFGMRFLGMSIGTFLVAILIFGAFIYHQVNELEILTSKQASMARGILVVSLFVILVIEAFTEDLIQGILSLFLPPYSIVYGLLFADAGPIRGLTMAILVFFGAEMYFTPDNALVPKTAKTIGTWYESSLDVLVNPKRHEAGFSE